MVPEITNNNSESYELKFPIKESEEFDYKSILVDESGFSMSPYTKKDNTKEIVINAIPLPQKPFNGVLTAYDFLQDKSKGKFVLYDGIQSSLNTTLETTHFLIPNLYENEYKEFIDMLISSQEFNWEFLSTVEEFLKLNENSIVYAYKQYHLIKTIRKEKINDTDLLTEIITKALK